MRNIKLLPALIGATLVIAVILYVAFHFLFLDFFVDLWWYGSLKLEGYFWLKLLYKFFFLVFVTSVFSCIFIFHFWLASRYLGLNPPDDVIENTAKRLRYLRLSDRFASGSIRFYTPISLVLGVFIAIPFYHQWDAALLYFFGSASGVTESIYGNDVSFYMLSYPMYQLIQQELLVTAILVFISVSILYWMEHIFVPNQGKEYHLGAKVHLTVLIGFIVAFVVWGFLLHRFSLLYDNSHEPVFYGPGSVEIRYRLPLIWLSIASFLVTALSAYLFIFFKQFRKKTPIFVGLTVFLCFIGLNETEFFPKLIEKFIVNPNPVRTEKPFMQHNIDATLDAYDLKRINIQNFEVKLDAAQDIATWSTQKRFENIPVWDREFLIHSYKQLQEIRPYYQILSVDEDRYDLLGHTRQVNLAAREVDITRLPKAAQNWENTHLRYTHGDGAVVSPAAQDADKPLVWYLRDLNMNSEVGLKVAHSEIYFGEGNYNYAVVPNRLNVVGLEETDTSKEKNYTGEGGIRINSLFRKLLFAFYFKEEKVFFSSNFTDQSQILIHRNIVERVNKLAPFLRLDKDPYLVMGNDRFYWILDAYTLSNWYPIAKPAADDYLAGDDKFNYIRNSAKVIVDAFDGTVSFYNSDPSDPIIKAYSAAYPGLFKKLSDMPGELRQHLRYPRDLFYMQMKVYAKYHQQDPNLFFEQGETWQFANVRGEQVMPYYQTMDFGNCSDREEFVLINPMTAVNRLNLSMIGVASTLDKNGCTSDYKPSITVYKFGKDVQVNGPAQVEALIEQKPEISEQFTLWDQHGTSVGKGRMVILPMGRTVLYVQPIYLISSITKIPELTRVIVSVGNEVVMDKTLWSAFKRLKDIYLKDTTQSVEPRSTQ